MDTLATAVYFLSFLEDGTATAVAKMSFVGNSEHICIVSSNGHLFVIVVQRQRHSHKVMELYSRKAA